VIIIFVATLARQYPVVRVTIENILKIYFFIACMLRNIVLSVMKKHGEVLLSNLTK
jgi:hypothetical protein